jgi:hypothetical protein
LEFSSNDKKNNNLPLLAVDTVYESTTINAEKPTAFLTCSMQEIIKIISLNHFFPETGAQPLHQSDAHGPFIKTKIVSNNKI